MNYKNDDIIYWKKNNRIIQEIVKEQIGKKIYVYNRKRPLNYNKVSYEPEYLLKRNNKYKKFIFIALCFAIFAIPAPFLFTHFYTGIDLSKENYANIANTIYGLTGPFIAIGAAILTYMAFLMQKQANDIQIDSTTIQIKKNQIDSFENRLFKLIDEHRKNVEELTLNGLEKGQATIEEVNFTISFVARLIKEYNNKIERKEIQVLSYLICTHGELLYKNNWFKKSTVFSKYATQVNIICYVINKIEAIRNLGAVYQDTNSIVTQEYLSKYRNLHPLISIRGNNMNNLSRYFRQIFQIYKYIDSQQFLNKTQKYEYAKIFRTELSNADQELMFNNILSPFGNEWRKYNFIYNYRPFKNIATYNAFVYSPEDYLINDEKISEDLSKFLDVLNYK